MKGTEVLMPKHKVSKTWIWIGLCAVQAALEVIVKKFTPNFKTENIKSDIETKTDTDTDTETDTDTGEDTLL